jgi:hypothetical protein
LVLNFHSGGKPGCRRIPLDLAAVFTVKPAENAASGRGISISGKKILRGERAVMASPIATT